MKYVGICLFLLIIFSYVSQVSAEYMLPYPSSMPGNRIYRITRLLDSIKKYWYFGSLGQIKYHISLADKYLVEAKTLMEYKQYLLASDALTRSDEQIKQLTTSLLNAADQYKDVSVTRQIISSEMQKHLEIFDDLVTNVPSQITWSPEKSASTTIQLENDLKNSKTIRLKLLSQVQ